MAQRVYTRKEREVWQACDALLEQGLELKQITIRAVGEELLRQKFNRGSDTDIHKHRLSWIAHHDFTETPENTEKNPITDRITKAAALLRKEVYTEVAEEIENYKKETQDQINNLELLLKTRQEEFAALLETFEQNKTEFEAQSNIQKSLQTKLRAAEDQNIRLTEKLLEKDHKIKEIKLQNQQALEAIYKQIDKIEFTHQKYLKELHNNYETQRIEYIKTIDKLTTENKKLNQDNKTHTEILTNSQKQLKAVINQLQQQIKNLTHSEKNTQDIINKFSRKIIVMQKQIKTNAKIS